MVTGLGRISEGLSIVKYQYFLKGTHGSDLTSILTLKCTIKARLPSWVLSIQVVWTSQLRNDV